jgi:hypothetical protein
MATCTSCKGVYHPKCANVSPKNAGNPYKCGMCSHSTYDRPSLHELAYLSDTHRWNFILPPAEMSTLNEILDRACRFAAIAFPIVDPHNDANPVRDLDLITHFTRKLFALGISFDAINSVTNERVVLEDWLFRRLRDARNPAKSKTRPRRPKLVLVESKEGEFSCVCKSPPLDALLVVKCSKCSQGYHMSCVRAPPESSGPEAKPWRCPCCTVKEGKHYQRNVDVRVQAQGESENTQDSNMNNADDPQNTSERIRTLITGRPSTDGRMSQSSLTSRLHLTSISHARVSYLPSYPRTLSRQPRRTQQPPHRSPQRRTSVARNQSRRSVGRKGRLPRSKWPTWAMWRSRSSTRMVGHTIRGPVDRVTFRRLYIRGRTGSPLWMWFRMGKGMGTRSIRGSDRGRHCLDRPTFIAHHRRRRDRYSISLVMRGLLILGRQHRLQLRGRRRQLGTETAGRQGR